MTSFDAFTESFGRIQGIVHSTLQDATEAELTYRPDEHANSVAWLIWHLTRVQDHHVADAEVDSGVCGIGGVLDEGHACFSCGYRWACLRRYAGLDVGCEEWDASICGVCLEAKGLTSDTRDLEQAVAENLEWMGFDDF